MFILHLKYFDHLWLKCVNIQSHGKKYELLQMLPLNLASLKRVGASSNYVFCLLSHKDSLVESIWGQMVWRCSRRNRYRSSLNSRVKLMQYLMKKEAKDFIDRSVWDWESGDGSTDLQLLTASAVARSPGAKDRKTDHFLSVPISPLAFASLIYLRDCYCITKMCSCCLLAHLCSLNLADPYAPTCLIPLAVLYYGTAHCSLLKDFPSSLQLSPVFSCFALVILWFCCFQNYISSQFLMSVQLFDFSEFSLAQVSYLI